MKRISFWKKIRFFKEYKRKILENSKELELSHNMRIDNAYRLYTVINVPRELFGEAYSLRKKDINEISMRYIRDEMSYFSKYLNHIGIKELYEMYNVKKIDKYSYLVVIGFSQFKSPLFYNIRNILYSLGSISLFTFLAINSFIIISVIGFSFLLAFLLNFYGFFSKKQRNI